MPLECSQPIQFKTEAVSLTEATHLQVKDEDATDSAAITTQAYVVKYIKTITPTAWMKAYGKRCTLIVEYIVKTDPGVGTVSVQTAVNEADGVEKTGLNVAAGKQTAVHSDITDFEASFSVTLEAKNSGAGQTSVLDYCNIYLQIGTKALGSTEVARITDIKSLSLDLSALTAQVWSGATDSCTLTLNKDLSGYSTLNETGTIINRDKPTLLSEFMLGVIDSYLIINMFTALATNPAVLKLLVYTRAWFE